MLEFSDEWATTKLRNESEIISKGTTPTTLGRVFVERGIAFVKIESITDDGRIDTEKLAYIDEATHTLLKRSQLKANDILFSIAGALGRVATADTHMLPANTNQALAFIRLKANSQIDHGYLIHYLRSNEIQKHIEAIQVQAAQANLSLENIRDFKIKFPPLPEQRAIATVLSDVDALLAKLDALIAKKRDIKQAAMQQLLTGKQRLPGFSGEWEVKRFGDIATPRKDRLDPRKAGAQEFCIELEHIEQGAGRLLGSASTGDQSSLKSIFQAGDVLFGKLRAYLRKYWLADREGVCSTEIWALMAHRRLVTPEFLFQLVTADQFIEAASTAYGTHMPRSDWNVVKNYEVVTPELDEQTAIAAVLSDMDAELAALEARREKTRALKQGMMQELLTGRIRLL